MGRFFISFLYFVNFLFKKKLLLSLREIDIDLPKQYLSSINVYGKHQIFFKIFDIAESII